MMSNKKRINVLILGGGSGCVSNIIVDRLFLYPDKYNVIVAGRTPMVPRNGGEVCFHKYDIYVEGSLQQLIDNLIQHWKTIDTVVNCIASGGKLSYNTTQIAYLNYVSVNTIVHIAKTFNATLIHMSSLKVGSPEDFDFRAVEKCSPWLGPRSPYAWSKLAAELKLLNSDLQNVTLVRIGLMDSKHGLKFYTRVRMICNFNVKVTFEKDLQDAIELSISSKGKHTVNVEHHIEQNVAFQRRLSGRTFLLRCPLWIFNFIFGRLLPTKMLDYVDPQGSFEYCLF